MAKKTRSGDGRTAGQAVEHARTPYVDDLDYLEEELRWVETRLEGLAHQARVGERTSITSIPSWGSDDDEDLTPSERSRRAKGLLSRADRLRADVDARLEATRAVGVELGLDRLARVHELDAFERQVVLLATAPVFSRRFDELFERSVPRASVCGLSVEAVFTFAGLDFRERIARRRSFEPGNALVKDELITLGLSGRYSAAKDLLEASLELSSAALATALGSADLDARFAEFSSVEEPRASFEQVVLDPADKARILAAVERHDAYLAARERYGFDEIVRYGRGAWMLFSGEPGTGKTLTAHAVAAKLGRRVLTVDIPTLMDHGEADRLLPSLFRAARVRDAVLFFDECEAIFGSRRLGNTLMTVLLTEIERYEGVAILATNMPELLDEALEHRILVRVTFPRPDIEARDALWRAHLPPAAPLAPDVDSRALAARFDMTGGYIKNAVLAALAAAVHEDGASPVLTMAQLERAAADQARRLTSDDGAAAVTTKARLGDLVLPDATRALLAEVVDATRHRATVLERWRVAAHVTYGRGLAVLLSGPPGTGKTMSAEAVAGELNRPLLVASVPAPRSKWVGDTEKQLEQLFARARAERAVLLLDEADTLLTARGEGNASRHDDAQVSVLLGLIERHDDLVLLATNRPEQLDPALARRVSYHIAFTAPDATARAAIWRGLVPESVPVVGELDFAALGRRHALSGGQIKNAALKAAFRAAATGALSQRDLHAAAAEEGAAKGPTRAIGFARTGAAA